MRILHIATEMAPWAKVGGLSQVVQGLSIELAKQHQVEVILPKYKCIPDNSFQKTSTLKSFERNKWYKNNLWQGQLDNIKLYLIDPLHPANYFLRDNIYGYNDDIARFLYFSTVAFEYVKSKGKKIDILHLHDWHTSIIALLRHLFLPQICQKIVLTIHNLAYQGICSLKDLENIGLKEKIFPLLPELRGNNHSINLLKGGINYSDNIIAVSPTYTQEILKEEFGYGLDSTLRKNKKKLHGILNGIDTQVWNPKNDPNLCAHYSSLSSEKEISQAKSLNKKELQNRLNLTCTEKPLIINVGRLVPQKGPNLIKHSILRTLKGEGQFILLGSSPSERINKAFRKLKKDLQDNPDVSLHLEYNETLAHMMFAAADFIIIPSLFEPCGLAQLIALRYATIPIVRKVGGLADTIFDIDDPQAPEDKKNGFTFTSFTPPGTNQAIDRALSYWFHQPTKLQKLITNAIKSDYSWQSSARQYLQIYQGTRQ